MAVASDQQVQQYVNERVRVRSEQIRALRNAITDDIAAIDDVYEALTQQSPTWNDERSDGPPNLLTVSDVLAWNAFINATKTAWDGDGNLPVVLSACVRPVGA